MPCMSAIASKAVAASSGEPRYQPLVIVLAAGAAGIVFDRFCPLPLMAWGGSTAVGLASWLALVYRRHEVVASFALLAAVAAAAGGWHHCQWYLFDVDELGRYARIEAQPACVEALAVSSPRAIPLPSPDPLQMMPASECWRFEVDLVALRNGAAWQPVSGRAVLLTPGPPPKVAAGDRLQCFVRLSSPPRPLNPGSPDRAAYLRAQRVRCRLQADTPECLTVIEHGSPWTLTRLLDQLRTHGNKVLHDCLDPRQAELAAAVLLGLREEIDGSRNEAFLATGTVHILSISGLHVGLLAGALFWLMRRLPIPRGWAAASVAAVTVSYALMVDVEPPVVRATVLVLVACCATYWGHRTFGMNSLAAAALVVLALNPAHLFHVGAQLSFLCVAGLIWIAGRQSHTEGKLDRSERNLQRLILQNQTRMQRALKKLGRDTISITLAGVVLWVLTLPLVMARFHLFSPVALILNTLLWIPMSLSVLSGFGVLALGAVCPPLGHLCGWFCEWNFRVLEDGVNWAQALPGSHFWVPGPSDWWLAGFYGALGLWLAFPRLRPARRWSIALATAWIVVGFAAARWPCQRDQLDCTFLSMGHGSAVFLELPSGETVLYDAGQFGTPSVGVRAISEFLWSRDITRLDTVVLSHPDIDHYNALPGLLEKFSVGEVCVSPAMFEKDSFAVRVLREAIDSRNIPIHEVRGGDCIQGSDHCTLEVLHPSRNSDLGPGNAGSIVLAVEYRGRRILLPGDLESPGLNDLLAEEPKHCEVLLAPHHGSRKSNSPELARWCTPTWVVFSGDGRWSLPEIEVPYRAVGGQVLHTFKNGAIQVRIDTEGVRVSPFVLREQ